MPSISVNVSTTMAICSQRLESCQTRPKSGRVNPSLRMLSGIEMRNLASSSSRYPMTMPMHTTKSGGGMKRVKRSFVWLSQNIKNRHTVPIEIAFAWAIQRLDGSLRIANGIDLPGAVRSPQRSGNCLTMIMMPIAASIPSMTGIGKILANSPTLKKVKTI